MTTEKKNKFKETLNGIAGLTFIVVICYFVFSDSDSEQTDSSNSSTTVNVAQDIPKLIDPSRLLGLDAIEFKDRWNKNVAIIKASEFNIESLEVTEGSAERGQIANSFKQLLTENVAITGGIDKSTGQLFDTNALSTGSSRDDVTALFIAATLLYATVTEESISASGDTVKKLVLEKSKDSEPSSNTIYRNGFKFSYTPLPSVGNFFYIEKSNK